MGKGGRDLPNKHSRLAAGRRAENDRAGHCIDGGAGFIGWETGHELIAVKMIRNYLRPILHHSVVGLNYFGPVILS
ncbi:hypothetical protein GCM10027594_04640 [Hymenobacter agri]